MADSPPRRKPRLEAGAEGDAATVTAPDLLSPLPLEILDKILSRLHIYDVVRTSVLSRAWRRRWETLPTVNLFDKQPIPADEVDSLLLRRTAPLRTFQLVGHRTWYVDAVHDWLLYLSRNGVENLILWFPPVGFQLHSSLFSCRELTSLDLTNCRLPPAPAGFAGFPSLKTLQFNKVVIPEHGGKQLAALIARSPSIETVALLRVELIGDDPEAEDEWVIQAPNLRELTIASSFPYGGRVEDLPRLQKGFLFGCNYAKFLMGMAHVTELEFACGFDWSAEVDVLDRLPFLFENLRSLVISVDFTEMFAILSLFCLLRSAPVLEELILRGWSDGSQVINADEKFLNAQWVDGMFAKLHVVRMKNILCLSNEMHFVEFILSKARVLQVLSVRLGPDALCGHEKAVITIKEYPKASPNAQVIFLGSESTNTGPINTSTENAKVGEVQTTGREHDSIEIPAEDAEMEETQTEDHKRGSIPTSTENDEAEEIQTTGREHDSIDTPAENVEMEDTQIEDGKCGSISTSTENDEAGKIQTIGRKHDCMDTPAENVEMEQTQRGDGKCGSISTSTENGEAGEIQTTTGRKHDCMDTPAENVEMEQTQTGDGKCGSISTSTENGEVGETQTTTGSGCGSIDTSIENANVDEAQTTGSEHESINTSTENAEVEERQTACSGQVNDVHPRRRHRLDLESVAQLEQMEVDIQKLQEDMRLNLDTRRLELENRTLLLNFLIENLKYGPCFKELSEHTNISLPPFPEPSSVLSSLLVTSRAGGSPANLGVNGAASVNMDSSEDVGLNSADNAQPDPHEDATINVAIMAPGDSSGHA